MTRSYATPAAFKQGLEHRLRERVAGSGTELARLRQLLVFDRFLARIVVGFGERVVLKGGLAIELRLERARTTKDVDLGLRGDPDRLLEQLREAGRRDLGDFLGFEIMEDPRHPEIEAEEMRYQGRRYRARALIAGKIYGSPFGVDVAFAESPVGKIDRIDGSDLLAFAGVLPATFRIYPLEAHLAEKLHAYTMPRSGPNSRVKDLPDLALLATVRPIEADALREAIRRTFRGRGTHAPPSSLPDPPAAWKPVYERVARTDGLPGPTIEELTEVVRAFWIRLSPAGRARGAPTNGPGAEGWPRSSLAQRERTLHASGPGGAVVPPGPCMRRHRAIFDRIACFRSLLRAYRMARRAGRVRPQTTAFDYELERNLLDLRDELASGRHAPGPYRSFLPGGSSAHRRRHGGQ